MNPYEQYQKLQQDVRDAGRWRTDAGLRGDPEEIAAADLAERKADIALTAAGPAVVKYFNEHGVGKG